MFADDVALVKEAVEKYGPAPTPVVDVGGLSHPVIADYTLTLIAMEKLRAEYGTNPVPVEKVRDAQMCRYLQIAHPLSFLGPYVLENPEAGGLAVEDLPGKYPRSIGTAILLSVLEHVEDPFYAVERLSLAMKPGGLAVVSVPWAFPWHGSPEDHWRFSPSALRFIFQPQDWEVLECDWRLDIPADAGVIDVKTGRPQTIQSCYLIGKAR